MVQITGKPKGHGYHIRTLVGLIVLNVTDTGSDASG